MTNYSDGQKVYAVREGYMGYPTHFETKEAALEHIEQIVSSRSLTDGSGHLTLGIDVMAGWPQGHVHRRVHVAEIDIDLTNFTARSVRGSEHLTTEEIERLENLTVWKPCPVPSEVKDFVQKTIEWAHSNHVKESCDVPGVNPKYARLVVTGGSDDEPLEATLNYWVAFGNGLKLRSPEALPVKRAFYNEPYCDWVPVEVPKYIA